MNIHSALLAVTAAALLPTASLAQNPPVPAASFRYADLADLALAAPLTLVGTVARASRLSPELSAGVAPGRARFYVESDVNRLIRGAAGLPPRIAYLADVPLDARGRPPKLKGAQVLLFAKPVPGKPGQIQLVAPDAQLPLTADAESQVRAILTEALAADAPPRITGVSGAFHVPGVLPGESETQIFLTTADRQPISLSILRRPNQAPSWAVALGEIVDEAARPPEPQSLLWYRLACGLPERLPEDAVASMAPERAAAARTDYRFVRDQLGPCARARPPVSPN